MKRVELTPPGKSALKKPNFIRVIKTILFFRRKNNTVGKVSKYGVFSGPNTGKYGPVKTPCLDTFHTV